MAALVDILPYYADRLILQYRDKPRARATIQLAAKQMIADAFLLDIQNAFDLDSAVGDQLTTIGKYIGVSRYYKTVITGDYYGFKDYDSGEPQNTNGMRDYAGGFNEDVKWLSYTDRISASNWIGDDVYRILLKFQIIINQNDSTLASIQSYLLRFFGDSIYLVDNLDMTLTYYYSQEDIPLSIDVINDFLPRPMGVGIDIQLALGTALRDNDASEFKDNDGTDLRDNLS